MLDVNETKAPVISSEDGTLPRNLPISGRVASHNPLPTLNNSHQQSSRCFSPLLHISSGHLASTAIFRCFRRIAAAPCDRIGLRWSTSTMAVLLLSLSLLTSSWVEEWSGGAPRRLGRCESLRGPRGRGGGHLAWWCQHLAWPPLLVD